MNVILSNVSRKEIVITLLLGVVIALASAVAGIVYVDHLVGPTR